MNPYYDWNPMPKKNRIKSFAKHLAKSPEFYFGFAVGSAVIGIKAAQEIRGLDIIDINLIHDTVDNLDFLCVARANGTFQNFLFEYTNK